jgi:hypothetical protein
MADTLLTVRRCAIGWFVGEDAGLVDQFVVFNWLGCYVVESRSGRIIVSVVWS